MALPTYEELDAAFEAGRSAPAGTRNPHFFGTQLWIQWDHGRFLSEVVRIENSVNRLALVGRITLWTMFGVAAAALARFALL